MTLTRRDVFATAGAAAATLAVQKAPTPNFSISSRTSVIPTPRSRFSIRASPNTGCSPLPSSKWRRACVGWKGRSGSATAATAGQRHPEQPHHALRRSQRKLGRVPAALEFRQRQRARPPGPADLLRTSHPPRHRTEYDGKIPCSRITSTASASTRRTTLCANRMDRSGSPIRHSASAAIGKATSRHPNCRIRSTELRPTASWVSSRQSLQVRTGSHSRRTKKKLYIIESRAQPNRLVWSFDVGADGVTLSNKTKLIDGGASALDGMKVDTDGNIWCGWGSTGAPNSKGEELDGVKVFNPEGKAIGFIRLPERCPNLVFGGTKKNRLYMASSPFALRPLRRGARRGLTFWGVPRTLCSAPLFRRGAAADPGSRDAGPGSAEQCRSCCRVRDTTRPVKVNKGFKLPIAI